LEVLNDDPADFERQIVDGLRTEALPLRFDPVYARRQRGGLVIAVAVGLDDALGSGGLVAHGDFGAGDNGPGLICHSALKCGG
jgi:hypothetical protein